MPPKSGMVQGDSDRRHLSLSHSHCVRVELGESQQGERGGSMKKTNEVYSSLRTLTKPPDSIMQVPRAQGEMRNPCLFKK